MSGRERAGERGFTLVELMVVLVVFSVLSTVATATVINIMQASRKSQERTYRSSEAQAGIEQVSKDARVAIPVVSAGANDLTVRVYRDGICQVRRYYVDATTETLMTSTRHYTSSTSCATASGVAGAESHRVLVRHVTNGTANPLLTYYTLTSNGREELTAPVASADLDSIQGVVIELDVDGPEGTSPIRLRTSVELRNN